MVVIFGFGNYARELFNKYYIQADEIKGIVDKNPCSISIHKRNPWLNFLVDVNDKPTEIQAISWETYFEKREDYLSDYAVIGSAIYKNEITRKLLDNKIFEKDQIISIEEWISGKPYVLGGWSESEKLASLCKKAGEIEMKFLEDAKILPGRESTLERLPKDMTAAEVGVAFGDFSEKILKYTNPKKFYAIDIFDEHVTGCWGKDVFKEEKKPHLEWYRNRFQSYIDSGIMETVKGKSWDSLSTFPDNYFDFVYLDAAHDYDSVKRDVEQLKRVVKHGGIIQFNDYVMFDYIAGGFYGVIPAVHSLINETQSKVIFYCLSMYGSGDIVVQLNKG